MRLGVTGNIGSGKSTVAREFARLGAAVVDADALAREATSDPAVLAAIRDEFGPRVFAGGAQDPAGPGSAGQGGPEPGEAAIAGGELDRAALAAIVFGDPARLARLNAIIHPWVRRESETRAAAHLAAGIPAVVFDIPLLYENGLEAGLDAVVVVSAPLETRIGRVAARSGLDRQAILERDGAQWPLERKVELADYVVDNAGDPESLGPRVAGIWRELGLPLPAE